VRYIDHAIWVSWSVGREPFRGIFRPFVRCCFGLSDPEIPSFIGFFVFRGSFLGRFFGGFFGSILSGFWGSIFSAVLDPNFHGSFSVGHCPGNCLFHWVLCDFRPVFECFVNSGLNWPFVQCPPCLKEFLCPFALDVFWTVLLPTILEVNLDPLFCCFSDDDLPVYRRFWDLKCRFWTRF
jgi:hypothetical protein